MKKLIACLLVACSASAIAAPSPLLENALSCKLKDKELATLMRDLAAKQPAFAKPAKQFGAPSADLYRLPQPVSALGYSSAEVVVTPGRILLAVPDKSVSQAVPR
ncbi:hypothetical protein [Pseudoduganella chitinolytica]|uniref:Uncharacterized protein n=1 Tax=Pseudoduganella chitinolytica TaxID=34070 RepID=A0ABY8BCJ5_9BURK|nr:hypothetical protein [Pseudoduganella chitinolytica]WEF32728.1 hypothetical protein PX653_25510 [Pseudoduganella chitinolytica]